MLHVYAHRRALTANHQGDAGQPFPLISQCWPNKPMNIEAMVTQQLALTIIFIEFATMPLRTPPPSRDLRKCLKGPQ